MPVDSLCGLVVGVRSFDFRIKLYAQNVQIHFSIVALFMMQLIVASDWMVLLIKDVKQFTSTTNLKENISDELIKSQKSTEWKVCRYASV